MESGAAADAPPGSSSGDPSPSYSSPAAAATTSDQSAPPSTSSPSTSPAAAPPAASQPLSRYESQKRRDWNTFLQYLKNQKPSPVTMARCTGAHVVEFLRYLDQFGKTKVHATGCPYFGTAAPPAPCPCPLRQAWGSLDALIGRLRAAYDESGGRPETNPFAARAVRAYLREVRESQAQARGIPYEKRKRKRVATGADASTSSAGASGGREEEEEEEGEKGEGKKEGEKSGGGDHHDAPPPPETEAKLDKEATDHHPPTTPS